MDTNVVVESTPYNQLGISVAKGELNLCLTAERRKKEKR